MRYPLVIIGGGLSGLAAGIRFARFGYQPLILEKHALPGGLNSYYYRQGMLFETGLHAMTNFSLPRERHAPLSRLFRQLKLPRKDFTTHEQYFSEILFPNGVSLAFSNDFEALENEVASKFPHQIDRFRKLVEIVDSQDPFAPQPRTSAREQLQSVLTDELLVNMLFWPLMIYGNSEEHDMDFSQFVIMFRAIFQEGLFRPDGTIKDFLDLLLAHYRSFGGEIMFNSAVTGLDVQAETVRGVRLASGEMIECDALISTAGYPATLEMLPGSSRDEREPYEGRVSFFESIHVLPQEKKQKLKNDRTIIFYNFNEPFDYSRPSTAVDPNCGVICFPENFQGLPDRETFQIRVTNPANYALWKQATPSAYREMKEEWVAESLHITGKIIGNYRENIVYQDSFTPLTIEKYSGKSQGAVYGSPIKIKDGRTACSNLFIAGTDQGYLGIVGSMLSGVTIVNQHILGRS